MEHALSIATLLGKHCTLTQDFWMIRSHWWTHSNAATHVSSALQQNHRRALSQSGAERGEWRAEEREGQRGRGRKPEIVTNTVVGSKARWIESYWKRKKRECRKVWREELLCSCTWLESTHLRYTWAPFWALRAHYRKTEQNTETITRHKEPQTQLH